MSAPTAQNAPDGAKSVTQFYEFYGMGRPTAYNEIAAGRLQSIKVGRRRIITPQQELRWLELLEAEQKGAWQ